MVAHVAFIPNAPWRPGRIQNLMAMSIGRARFVTEQVFGFDMEEQFETAFREKLAMLDVDPE